MKNERANEWTLDWYWNTMSLRKCYTEKCSPLNWLCAFTIKLSTYCAWSISEYTIFWITILANLRVIFLYMQSVLFVIGDHNFIHRCMLTSCSYILTHSLHLSLSLSRSCFHSFFLLLFTCVYVCACVGSRSV